MLLLTRSPSELLGVSLNTALIAMDSLPNELLQDIITIAYDGLETDLERQTLRFTLQKLSRRWFEITPQDNTTAVVNTASKAERLAQVLKKDKIRASKLLRLELHFTGNSQSDKTWLRENKWSLLLKQCPSIKQLVIRDVRLPPKYGPTGGRYLDDEVFDALTNLDQLESFACLGYGRIQDKKSRTVDRSVNRNTTR